ncbi:MAG: hypothetical protein ABMB14_32100 [Myxococcota bacterium]
MDIEARAHAVGVYLQVAAGVGIVFGLHGLIGLGFAAAVAAARAVDLGHDAAGVLLWLLLGWGMGLSVAQLAYVVPAFALAWRVRRPLALGVALGGALTAALHTTCWGAVWLTRS